MMRYFGLFLLACALAEVAAFAPALHRPPPPTTLSMADDTGDSGGALVPINEDTIQFSAGTIGTILGLFVGGPVLGGITGVATNYLARKDVETASEVVKGISEGAIGLYNAASGLGSKAVSALKDSNPDVKDALKTVEEKIEQYDVLEIAEKSLSTVGDVAENVIDSLLSFADEQGLADKASKAMNEAKSAADKAINK